MNKNISFNKIFFATILIVFFIFSGCALIQKQLAILNCKFQIASIGSVDYNPLKSLDVLGVTLNIDCKNPNSSVAAVLEKLAFDLYVNEQNMAESSIANNLTIPPNQTIQFPVNIQLSLSKAGSAIFDAIKSGTASYKLKGNAFFSTPVGEMTLPVTISKGKWSGD